jgi:hypothetical protein
LRSALEVASDGSHTFVIAQSVTTAAFIKDALTAV